MKTENLSQLPDSVRRALPALQRASLLARKTAIDTNTSLVVVRDGQLVNIPATALRQMVSDHSASGQEQRPAS